MKDVENDGMWEHFSCERSKAKKFRELADEEKQAGIQGQWQQESPAKEFLEQVKWYLEQVVVLGGSVQDGSDAAVFTEKKKRHVATRTRQARFAVDISFLLHLW